MSWSLVVHGLGAFNYNISKLRKGGGGFLLCADNADAGGVTKFRKDADVILEHSLHVVEDGGYRVGAACDSVGDNDDEEEAEETRCGSVRDARTLVQTHCP